MALKKKKSDNSDIRQCSACYKAADSADIKSWVSQSRKVQEDCETVLLNMPSLDGSAPLTLPVGAQGSGLRESLRQIRDNHNARGMDYINDEMLLIRPSYSRSSTKKWEFLPAPRGFDVTLSAQ